MTLTEECNYAIMVGRYLFKLNENLSIPIDDRYPYWDQPRLIEFSELA